MVTHTSGKTLAYKDLIDDVLTITPPEADKLKLKERKEWRYINTGMAHIDLQDIVTGKANLRRRRARAKSTCCYNRTPTCSGR